MNKITYPVAMTARRDFLPLLRNLLIRITRIDKVLRIIFILIFATTLINLNGQTPQNKKPVIHKFQIPPDYLREPENIPAFWLSTYDDVTRFLNNNVHKGHVEIIGTSAGGRQIRAVVYGKPRRGKVLPHFRIAWIR